MLNMGPQGKAPVSFTSVVDGTEWSVSCHGGVVALEEEFVVVDLL
jgi:hypothetical protein